MICCGVRTYRSKDVAQAQDDERYEMRDGHYPERSLDDPRRAGVISGAPPIGEDARCFQAAYAP